MPGMGAYGGMAVDTDALRHAAAGLRDVADEFTDDESMTRTGQYGDDRLAGAAREWASTWDHAPSIMRTELENVADAALVCATDYDSTDERWAQIMKDSPLVPMSCQEPM